MERNIDLHKYLILVFNVFTDKKLYFSTIILVINILRY